MAYGDGDYIRELQNDINKLTKKNNKLKKANKGLKKQIKDLIAICSKAQKSRC